MIEVRNFSKKYGSYTAVKDISFTLGKGEILGLLGPNGAGKTTIMKALGGCHYPTEGEVKIMGISLMDSPMAVKKNTGYLSEKNPLYGDLSPGEYLDFCASARSLCGEEKKKAVNRALDLCGLYDHRKQPIDTLSKGYRQRLGLAQAIIHDPPVLILDEPGSALDPNQIIEMRNLIKEFGKKKTVILSTHILSEAEALSTSLLILNRGRAASQGTIEEISNKLDMDTDNITLEDIFVKITGGKTENEE